MKFHPRESRQFGIVVSLKVHENVCRRARELGLSATGLTTMFFDAGYAARIGQERDDPVSDADLDEQVRLVFACAGQSNTAAIARATGVPEARVERILAAWKTVAKQGSTKRAAARRAS